MHKYHSSRLFQSFAIIVLSSLCLLLNSLTRINFNKIQLPKNRPQYNATGVVGTVYNQVGAVKYSLNSNEAWEYPDDERIYLKNFVIDIYAESTADVLYHITSDNGWLNNTTKIGLLGEHTVITVSNTDPNKVIKMYGTNINLNIDKNIFSSSESAHAIQGADSVYSQGFIYDNNQQLLTLESQVHVTYFESGSEVL